MGVLWNFSESVAWIKYEQDYFEFIARKIFRGLDALLSEPQILKLSPL